MPNTETTFSSSVWNDISPNSDRSQSIEAALSAMRSSQGRPTRSDSLDPFSSDTSFDVSGDIKLNDLFRTPSPRSQPQGKSWCMFDTCVGIEIELEGLPNGHDLFEASYVWRTEGDGSLRNYGVELVSRGPVGGARLEQAISELTDFLEDYTPEYSERCSTHVHVDVTDLTLDQLNTFLGCAIIMEPVLFRLHGQGREFNGFCCPVFTNSNLMDNYIKLFTQPKRNYNNLEFIKYAGISLYRLRDLGTVEFRMFNAIKDPHELQCIVELLAGIKSFSKTVQSPDGLIDFKRVNSVRSIYSQCTGKDCDAEFEVLLEQGVQALNDICIAATTSIMVATATVDLTNKIDELQAERQSRSRGVPRETTEFYNLGA